jgi:hypothetical protein
MNKHTPGPWTVKQPFGHPSTSRTFGVHAEGHGYIVMPHSKTANPTVDAEHEANCYAIAAVPDMCAFIESVANDDNACTCVSNDWHGEEHTAACVQQIAAALLYKIKYGKKL